MNHSAQAAFAVVIPAYDEAGTIRGVVERALRHIGTVVVVDDGSTDATAAALTDLPVTVLRNADNLGKAASLRRGIAHAVRNGASAVITLDADGQHDPDDIPRLISAHLENPGRIVIGARLHEKCKIPRSRYLANRFANFWFARAAGYSCPDSQSGFRIYPANVLRSIGLDDNTSMRFVFETEVLIDAARSGITSVAVPIAAIYKADARPSHFRPVVDVLLITRMVAWKILNRPVFYRMGGNGGKPGFPSVRSPRGSENAR